MFSTDQAWTQEAAQPKQIGAQLEAVDDARAKQLGLPATMGSVVTIAIEGAPAANAGLKANDVILMVNGEFPADYQECLSMLKAACKKDGDIQLNVFRAGEELEITVRPAVLTDAQTVNFTMANAAAGDAESQLLLGYNHYNGIGVEKDVEKAIQWYRKAAEQGQPHAQENLARKYYTGRGVKQDYKES